MSSKIRPPRKFEIASWGTEKIHLEQDILKLVPIFRLLG